MKKKLLRLSFVIAVVAALTSCFGTDSKIAEVELIPVSNGDEYQYIDREGKISINPQFSEATVFRNDLALVKTSGDYYNRSWGYIDEEGKYAINAKYKDATVFSEEISWVVEENGAPTALNTKGDTLFVLKQAETVRIFKEGLAAFKVENEDDEYNWGFVDPSGKIAINPQFSYVSNFNEGMAAFRNSDGAWGYIDREGKIIINPQFDSAADFVESRAVVTLEDQYGIIDKEGKFLVNPQFDMARADGDYYMVKNGDKWGWCDNEGKMIINPQFDDAFPFLGENYAPVKSAGKYGFVDNEGKFVINPQFKVAIPFNGDLAMVESAGKIGLIDQEGKYVVNPQFESASRDYLNYIIHGSSRYESVNSDFVDIDAINAVINFDSPEGITLDNTFGEISQMTGKKFNSIYDYGYNLINEKKLTENITYSFQVGGYPYKSVKRRQGTGYYSRIVTENVYDPQAKPSVLMYYIYYTRGDLIDIFKKRIKEEGFVLSKDPRGEEYDEPEENNDGDSGITYEGKGKEVYLQKQSEYGNIIFIRISKKE